MPNNFSPSQLGSPEIQGRPSNEWLSDKIIEHPDAAWDLITPFPISVDELWAGKRGITRIGPADEGYAGYMLPSRLQGLVEGTKMAYLLPPPSDQGQAKLPRQLEVGSSIKDGNGSEKLTVVELDNELKQMTFEAQWQKAGKLGIHYSWELHALPGNSPNTSVLATRMRIEGLQNPGLWRKVGPLADRFTMNLVRKGVVGEDSSTPQGHRKLKAAAVMMGAATVGAIAAKKLVK